MSKQIYIDSNGNEVQVSGTVNTADMMPMSGNDSTKVATAIGDLSDLTTTDKSSLVGAVNEVEGEIPEVYVSSVNGNSGAVTLTGSDIEYSSGVSVNSQIDTLMNYIPVYGNTASGAIATFDTSLALPLQDCTIAINAVQEAGTPTPSSPKAISGFTGANIYDKGVNLWDEDWEVGGIAWTTGQNSDENDRIRSKNYIPVVPNITVRFSYKADVRYVWCYDQNKTLITNVSGSNNYFQLNVNADTLTLPTNCFYIRFIVWTTYGPTYNNNISINYPATDTTYHAYNANSTTTAITWQDEAGTVYGGSLDVTTGVLTVTHGIITFDGSGDEIWNDGTIRYSIGIADCERTAGRLEVLCNRGVYASSGGSDGTVFVSNTFFYYYQPTSITSLADFKTWLGSNNLVVVYPIATPVTYQLTPTQISAIVGTNNVFTDTNGNTSVVYACSLKDYIEGQ